MLDEYINLLGPIPEFLKKYFTLDFMTRLKKVGYFCGMDYASKDVFDFAFYISRFDHCLTTALLTWRYTQRKEDTLAAFFHDASTPSFSHVIDYMNEDFENQESTEENTENLLKNSKELHQLLKQDGISLESIINYKKYTIVDTQRPKLCADRLDGILLSCLAWTKELNMKDIENILRHTVVYQNDDGEEELGFDNKETAKFVLAINKKLDEYCHSNFDNFMMLLLAKITKYAIEKNVVTYNELFDFDEDTLFGKYEDYSKIDIEFQNMLKQFKTIKLRDIPQTDCPKAKRRIINPLVKGIRLLK